CIALGSVVLDGCIEVTSRGVRHIAKCSRKNLWRLSLRDLPLLREKALEPIAKYCTGLRFLALDVNRLVKETWVKGTGSDYKFLSIKDTGLLIELLKRCSSLETLKLSNVLDEHFAGWEDFAKNINPYLRTLSFAGAATFNDASLKSLTKNTPFLRELRLSGVRSLESAQCLLKPLQIDHPSRLSPFYMTQLQEQLEALVRNDTALAPPSSPFPLCCPAEMANTLDKNTREAIKSIDLLLKRMQEHNVAGLLQSNHDASTKILWHVVALVDFVRRVRARRKLSAHEYEEWEDLTGTKLAHERCNEIAERAESILDAVDATEESLRKIAKYCTGLRFLALDVNLLIKDTLAKEEDSEYKFLSIEDTGLLIELLKRCSSLETLKLSNVLGKEFAGWEDFAKNINPYLRTLSLAGAATFKDASLKSLAKKTPFLRELRLSGVRSLESAHCLLQSSLGPRAQGQRFGAAQIAFIPLLPS
ncbi:F-box/LRR-repeat protein 16, partial [Hondaea fermentalgiana]